MSWRRPNALPSRPGPDRDPAGLRVTSMGSSLPRMIAPVVGLTGGIASGKSTVGRMFADLGVPLLDADDVAREVVEPGTEGLEHVLEAFGRDLRGPDGHLDRKRLGAKVFGDPEARKRLNAILHPRIAARSAQRLADLTRAGSPYVLYEAALLVENGLHRTLAKLIVVRAQRAAQLDRLIQRDGLSEGEAAQRIDSQLPLEDKIAVADFVIDNDGEREATRAQVVEVDRTLNQLFASPRRSDS